MFGKKRFRFEKGWVEKDSFRGMVEKAWNSPCSNVKSIDRWQFKVRTPRRLVRGGPQWPSKVKGSCARPHYYP